MIDRENTLFIEADPIEFPARQSGREAPATPSLMSSDVVIGFVLHVVMF
jgi:hypothetical protein